MFPNGASFTHGTSLTTGMPCNTNILISDKSNTNFDGHIIAPSDLTEIENHYQVICPGCGGMFTITKPDIDTLLL